VLKLTHTCAKIDTPNPSGVLIFVQASPLLYSFSFLYFLLLLYIRTHPYKESFVFGRFWQRIKRLFASFRGRALKVWLGFDVAR